MTIAVQDLITLDPTLVAQFDAELTTLIQEANPTFYLTSGVLHDMLVHVKAQLDAATQTNINLVEQSNSLQAINVNPALADPAVAAACLSNYNITANPGAAATGTVTIVLDVLLGVVVPSNTIITINGLTFQPNLTYAARTSSLAVITAADTLIYPLTSGLWAFDIQVTATAIGAAGNVTRASVATLSTQPPNFVKAYVKSDFTGGVNADTTATLLAKLAGGLAVKAWSNRVSILGLLRAQPAFANILGISIIGFGDPEMTRDQHSIWPGSLGGRSDLYLQSQQLYQSLTVVEVGTLISKVGAVGTWQTGIGLNDAPGFYQVDRVLLPNQDQTLPGFAVISDVRGIDLTSPPSDTLPPPDVVTVTEGAYTRYQTSVIQWQDTVTDATDLSIGATQNYNVIMLLMPLVSDIQDFLNGRSQRPPMCDVLVKGAVPCFTTISLIVNYNSNSAAPSVPTMQTNIATAVNTLGFVGQLSRSIIDSVLHNTVPNLVSTTAYTLTGNIRYPDGTLVPITDHQLLSIPDDPANGVTGRTTLFFLSPSAVMITLQPVVTPTV